MITNNPWEKNTVTYPWAYYDNAFSDKEIEDMLKYFEDFELDKGTTIDNNSDNVIQENVRISSIKFHEKTEENSWIFNRLNTVIEEINNYYYGFNLYGYDRFQYTEYESSKKGKYDFHMDLNMGTSVPVDIQVKGIRKLSLTMLLNEPNVDFEGGDFEINQSQEKKSSVVELKKGRIIFFPSFMIHRVSPVTFGKRKSLVVWVLGPKFK